MRNDRGCMLKTAYFVYNKVIGMNLEYTCCQWEFLNFIQYNQCTCWVAVEKRKRFVPSAMPGIKGFPPPIEKIRNGRLLHKSPVVSDSSAPSFPSSIWSWKIPVWDEEIDIYQPASICKLPVQTQFISRNAWALNSIKPLWHLSRSMRSTINNSKSKYNVLIMI